MVREVTSELLLHLPPIEQVIAEKYIKEGRWVLKNDTCSKSGVLNGGQNGPAIKGGSLNEVIK
jgi:hypothetical protein